MNTFMNAGTYVMNCKTGKAYMIATDTIQTRNRRQLTGMEIRRPEVIQICVSHLRRLSLEEARLCIEAERICRGKHKRSVKDRAVIRAWRELRAKMAA